MEFRILGQLEVLDDGRSLDLGGAKQRALLAALLLNANRPVSPDRLIDALWEEDPPETAAKALQVHVSGLRKVLGKERIARDASGYVLRVLDEELDAGRFERLAGEGRLREALELWRGPPLADFTHRRFAQPEIGRLEELRVACAERRFDEDLAAGRHAEVIPELEALVAEHPLRERLRALLMRALYASGRQAEALEAYQEARRLLVEELGIEPSPELQELHRAILQQDPTLSAAAAVAPLARRREPRAERPPVVACPACGQRNPRTSRFCSACGLALAAAEATRHPERRVVTVLFIDLVGFTSRAELMDPEDVAELLAPYRARITDELERFGGTLEKFVGDGAMAVFGAPVAHEDDPERAVRAALAILEAVRAAGIDVRIGINTGEALITFSGPDDELTAAGDVVNTASRLESAAPVNGILVGNETYEATRDAIEYRTAAAVRAKGKRRPVPVWEAIGATGVVGAARAHATPLVGRRRELDELRAALGAVRKSRQPRLVTLVGGPGFGKSRLVHEFHEQREDAVWRQGRCVPYGSGSTYGAIGEIVKEHAGILDTDTPEAAARKLRRTVADALGDDPDAPWVEAHLRLLVGLGGEASERQDRRAEAFFAWRRFLERLAGGRPLVLVVEDLHWAGDDLLDFVDHLLEWVTEVPLLVLCTARPELFDRRPEWASEGPNRAQLRVPALRDDEVARLVSGLLGRAVLSADVQGELLERAAGNPLYAEQYTRLFLERGLVDGAPPPTLQGLIAARLDALDAGDKALVQAAAVVGRTFWTGSVAAVSGIDRWSIEERLRALERRELVRRGQTSSLADDTEWTFGHVLIRDVAYARIRRADRAEKHRLTAEWIESLGRGDEHAELIAHHYVAALELARTPELADRARFALWRAGERALALNAFASAAALYEKALELWPSHDAERPTLELEYGRALYRASGSGTEALVAARDGLLAAGKEEGAAEAEIMLAELASYTGEHDIATAHLERALALVEPRPESWAKAFVLSRAARLRLLRAEMETATDLAQRALAIAEALDLEEIRIHALNTSGSARVHRNDASGIDDVELSLALARRRNSPEIGRGYLNLSVLTAMAGDLERSYAVHEEGLREAERIGAGGLHRFLRGHRAQYCYWNGRWDEAVASADEFLREVEAGSPHYEETQNRNARALIRLARGDVEGALDDTERSEARAREVKDPQALLPALAVRAFVLLTAGERPAAQRLAAEVLAGWAGVEDVVLAWGGAGAVSVFAALEGQGALRSLDVASTSPRPWLVAALAYLDGDFARAADVYARVGSSPDEAYARLRAAEQLAADGDEAAAERQRAAALGFFRSVAAARYTRAAERLLAASA